MTYNALRFDADAVDRTQSFHTVISACNPDVVLMQEIDTSGGALLMESLLQQISVDFTMAAFNYDGACYYRTSLVDFVSSDIITTPTRDITEFVLEVEDNRINLYNCHLKASTGYEADRLAEVTELRKHLDGLPEGTDFLLVGDMNLYTSEEPAYQYMMSDGTNIIGKATDLIDEVGAWHNNILFAHVHTQATREGEWAGGLDDRFDFILSSVTMDNRSGIDYVDDSYTAFGNDGNHFNVAITNGTNAVVSQAIANALHAASDHLPVYADFVSLSRRPVITGITIANGSITITWQPIAQTPFYKIRSADAPDGAFTDDTSGTYSGSTTWQAPVPTNHYPRFYRVRTGR